jgi:hypothetical protein
MRSFIDLIYIILLAAATMLFGSYVLHLMWAWLIVPIFAVKYLTVGQSFAIMVFKSYFFYKKDITVKEEELSPVEKANKNFIEVCVLYGMSLLFAWIATSFI